MDLIKYVSDQTLDGNSELGDWNIRQAVRAVVLDMDNRIALMHIGKFNVYKLPGGGIDNMENIEAAFQREMLEETGCEVKKIRELGVVIEKRDEWKLVQVSYCYVAKVVKIGDLQLTTEEIAEDFSLHWVSDIGEAVKLVESSGSKRYDDKYIKIRDSAILQKAKNLFFKDHSNSTDGLK